MIFLVCMEWSFSPKDYFEEDININIEGYKVKIPNDGLIKLDIPFEDKIDEITDDILKLRDSLTEQLNALFLGVQSITGEAYKLENPRLYEVHADGKKFQLLSAMVNAGSCKASIDFIIEDQNNCVIQDTKRERIAKKEKIVKTINSFFCEDLCLRSILYSYQRSLREPNNKLIHLYDIKTAIESKISEREKEKDTSSQKQNKKKTKKEYNEDIMVRCLAELQSCTLGDQCIYDLKDKCIHKQQNQCSDSNYYFELKRSIEYLRKLANIEVKQGRHRGDKFSQLRDATESELEKSDKIARGLIEAYAKYLESYKSK